MLKRILVAIGLGVLPWTTALAFDGTYFHGIWEGDNYRHPAVSAGTNITLKGKYDGLTTQVALAWHKSDPADSLIPQALQNIGVKPFSWTLLSCGGGYGNGEGLATCGSSVNVAPTLMGPAAQALKATGNPGAAAVGTFLAGAPNGSGLALGYTWNSAPIQHGTLMPLDRWGSHLDAFIGASYTFP